jgi:hypothetical protein
MYWSRLTNQVSCSKSHNSTSFITADAARVRLQYSSTAASSGVAGNMHHKLSSDTPSPTSRDRMRLISDVTDSSSCLMRVWRWRSKSTVPAERFDSAGIGETEDPLSNLRRSPSAPPYTAEVAGQHHNQTSLHHHPVSAVSSKRWRDIICDGFVCALVPVPFSSSSAWM